MKKNVRINWCGVRKYKVIKNKLINLFSLHAKKKKKEFKVVIQPALKHFKLRIYGDFRRFLKIKFDVFHRNHDWKSDEWK